MDNALFGSDLWEATLDKFTLASGLTVALFGADLQTVLESKPLTPLAALFREHGIEPGLFAECARRCLAQSNDRTAIAVAEAHGLMVVGTSLVLEGAIVGAAVAGYALGDFPSVDMVRHWAVATGLPFDRLWNVVRRKAPLPQRRLMLHGELLQVLGDALLRENLRARQYQEMVLELRAAAAAKDEFLAVLSHELRTPLTPILNWANVLKTNPSPDHVRAAAEAIKRNVYRESRIVEDLLDITRIAHGSVDLTLGTHPLAALVRAALDTSTADPERKAIRLEFIDAAEPLYVVGDADRLQQVFGNILSNAVKFTPEGGSVLVVLRRETDHAVVQIADTGKGITADFLPFVFDMFRQQEGGTRRAHGGLGIGLALVKRLVELHKGTVTVVSSGAERGTEVTVRLPLSDAAAASAGAMPNAAAPPVSPLGELSILVVEDAEDSRESLRDMLELLGANVFVAADGREALDVIRRTTPDLVLCDLRMPRMDGYDFIHALHERPGGVHPPVVAVSGLVSDTDQQRTREAGFEGHVKKPFDETTIVAAVRAALSHRDPR
jgi:signal transduction histidine kinase